jgi:hypothetical protein
LPVSHSFHSPDNPAHPGSTTVAQVSKPAVSPTSKSAGYESAYGLRVWKPATQQVWKPALRPTGASSEQAVAERARWKIPHMNTIPGHDGLRYLRSLLLTPSPFESASNQRRFAASPRRSIRAKAGHASHHASRFTFHAPRGHRSLSGKADKFKCLALNIIRTPKSVGLCPENRPDGGTNSPPSLRPPAAPTCRAEASERRREPLRRREPCEGRPTLPKGYDNFVIWPSAGIHIRMVP